MATEATITTTPTVAAAASDRTVRLRLFVDDSTKRVVFAEAGEDAVAFILSVLADPRAAVEEMLREDPAFAVAGCYASLSAFQALVPRVAASASTSSLAPALPRGTPAGKVGRGIMAWRLFRCDHLGCRCSDVASRTPGSACRLRDAERGRDFLQCRYRVTDERGVRCPLCHGLTSVEVKCAKGSDGGGEPPTGSESSCRYAILDDLTARPVVSASARGLGVAALLSAVGVTADSAALREVDVAPSGTSRALT